MIVIRREWVLASAISDADLMTLRKQGSKIQGHPAPALNNGPHP
jgi:transketolase